MPKWLNEYEVEEYHQRYANGPDTPKHIKAAIRSLSDLVEWTNSNSDGWPYWCKPAQAASKLCEVLQRHHHYAWLGRGEPVSLSDVKAALKPVKAFRTRQGAQGRTDLRLWDPQTLLAVY